MRAGATVVDVLAALAIVVLVVAGSAIIVLTVVIGLAVTGMGATAGADGAVAAKGA